MKTSKHKIILILILAFCTGAPSYGMVDTLSVNDCIRIALEKNPQIKLAQSSYNLYDAGLKSAYSVVYPQVNFQTGFTKNGGTYFIGTLTRPGNFENYNIGFQAQQLIYDFGKTYSKISAGSDLLQASGQDLTLTKQNVILNTYIAYFDYLEYMRIVVVSRQSLIQAQDHLNQAENFYTVGKAPQFDVLKAKTDEANARVNLLTAENGLSIRKLQLENIMNTKLSPDFILRDNLEVIKDTISLAKAIDLSKQNRPELIGAQYRMEANKSLVNSAFDANLPTVNASAGYSWRSFAIDQPFVSSWNFGLNLSMPIFAGFGYQAAQDQAKAIYESSEAQYELIQQIVELDVRQQYENVQLASARIDASRTLLQQAQEAFNLAQERYNAQVGSPIEITDARVTLLNAQFSNIQALYDYQVAYSRLQSAIGIIGR